MEAFPGQGAVFGRSAGSFCQVRSVAQDTLPYSSNDSFSDYAKIRLPSGGQRLISFSSRGTLGVVSTASAQEKNLQKAGRSR